MSSKKLIVVEAFFRVAVVTLELVEIEHGGPLSNRNLMVLVDGPECGCEWCGLLHDRIRSRQGSIGYHKVEFRSGFNPSDETIKKTNEE